MKDYRLYWIWLAEAAGCASKTAVKLINIFGNAAALYMATEKELDSYDHGMNARELAAAKRILANRELDTAQRILEDASRLGQRVIVPTDEDYPKSLLSLQDAPMVLYVLGNLPRLRDELAIAVVGTRSMSDSGRRNGYGMGYGLAAGGAVVVSGMALGVDGMALCGAISAGGRTIAVLGGGADVIYPRDHENLYNTILRRGAIISEYPPGSRPEKHHFPVRNRIISGLSAGCVVVEADMKSGALITARHAIYQGRHVFAFPGDVASPGAEGTNSLIKNGAVMTTTAEDVLSEYEFLYPHCVSMKRYYKAIRNLELDESSAEEMARLRISARDGNRYYGKGSYGGKGAGNGDGNTPKAPRVKASDRRHADDEVKFGASVAPTVTEKSGKAEKPKNIDKSGKTQKRKKAEKPKKEKTTAENPGADSAAVMPDSPVQRIELDLLEEVNIRVYNLMKPDVPMIPDELVREDLPINEVLSSLSMLELAGAVESGAGGYFLRRSSDDISFDLSDE